MAKQETTAEQLQRIVGMSQVDAEAMALKLDGAAKDLTSFKGPLDGLTKGERAEEFGKMLEDDRACFAKLERASSETLTRMAAWTE